MDSAIDPSELEAGDHVYSWRHRGFYSHHGIYVGDNRIVQYTATENSNSWFSGSPSSPSIGSVGLVSVCSLNDFRSRGRLYRYGYGVSRSVFMANDGGMCTTAPSDPPNIVVRRAKYLLVNGYGNYYLLKHNCEDFALYCKTGLVVPGRGSSSQAAFVNSIFDPIGWVRLAAAFIRGSFPAIFGHVDVSAECRYSMDIGNRPDAVRVEVEDLIASQNTVGDAHAVSSSIASAAQQISTPYSSDGHAPGSSLANTRFDGMDTTVTTRIIDNTQITSPKKLTHIGQYGAALTILIIMIMIIIIIIIYNVEIHINLKR